MHICKWLGSQALATDFAGRKSAIFLLLLLSMAALLSATAKAQDLPIDIQVIGNHRLEVGETVELLLLARQPFGQVPWLFAESRPRGSSISDNGDGTRTFTWTPEVQDVGESILRLIATDDANQLIRVTEEVVITVLPANSFISRLAIIAPTNVVMSPNEPVSIRVVAVDAEGHVPDLHVLNLPSDASFTDNGDGSRSINWIAPSAEANEDQTPVTGIFAVQVSAADDPGDTVVHVISYVVTNELVPFQQPRLEPLPQIFAPPAPHVVAGEVFSFQVEAFHSSGQVPALMISHAPVTSSFDDNGNGSREFIWNTDVSDIGTHPIIFTAVDVESGDVNTFESTLLVLANAQTIRANRIISVDVPLESVSLPGTELEEGFDFSENDSLIDVEFLVDSVDVLINGNMTETVSLLPGSNRLVINNTDSGVQYNIDIDRAAVADFLFTNQLGYGSYDLDVDGHRIALSTYSGVLIFTWQAQGSGYTQTAGALDQEPWSGPASTISLSGDTLAVASKLQEGVWVFENRGVGGWRLADHLQPDQELFPAGFGEQLILDGDTLVVSSIHDAANSVAERQDTSMPNSGAVAVFHREAGEWELQDILKASNAEAGDLFGISVALEGDTLVVGAVGEDSATTGVNSDQSNNEYTSEQTQDIELDAGAAYIFKRSNGIWEQTTYLKPSENNIPHMGFGSSVALSGDRIAVAAKGASYLSDGRFINGQPLRTGAVYVFDLTGNIWQETGSIRPTSKITYDFGSDMALQGDQLAVASDREVLLYQNIDNSWRTLWSSNLLQGLVDFNAPFLVGAGVENYASKTLIFRSGL